MTSKRSWIVWVLGFFMMVSQVLAATSWEYYQAGLRYYNQKQYDSAIRYFQASIQMDPQNWQAYQGLAYCYYSQGDKGSARANADKSLRINSNNPGLRQFANSLGSSNAPALPSQSSSNGPSPVIGGGNFGLGLEFGDPGTWGACGKYWMDNVNAFQGAVKIGGGTVLQFDYLWHDYDVIHPSQGAMPFYIGVGGDLALGGGSLAIGGRMPIGLTYLFQKKTVPIDIFVEAAPTLWFYSGGLQFDLYASLGSRFYF